MPYPAAFYHRAKKESPRYADQPGDTPDLERFFKSQPWWQTALLASEDQPRALILADWTIVNWLPEKIASIKKLFFSMMDQGFTFYAWQDRNVIALTKVTLDILGDYEFIYRMTPEWPENIIECAIREQRLTRDRCFILDDYWIQILNHERDLSEPRQVKTFDLGRMQQFYGPRICSILQAAQPPLTQIVHDYFSGRTNSYYMTNLQSTFPEAAIQSQFLHLKLTEQRLRELTATGATHSSHHTFHFSDLPTLQTLIISRIRPDNSLQALLKQCKSLKVLLFSDCYCPAEPFLTENLDFPELITLGVDDIGLRNPDLERLLSNAPKLKQLAWSSSWNEAIKVPRFTHQLQLPGLVQLFIGNNEFTGKTLQQLLSHSLHIQEIDIRYEEEIIRGQHFQTHAQLMTKLAAIPEHDPDNEPQWEIITPSSFSTVILPSLPQQMRDFTPTPPSFRFTFDYDNLVNNRSQRMVIERFSQYLTITRQHQDSLYKIQNGICQALSTYFLDHDEAEWNDLIDALLAWDGRPSTLNPSLISRFEGLWIYIEQYQLNQGWRHRLWGANTFHFYGKAVHAFLALHREQFLLANPWHAIAVRYKAETQTWLVLNTNNEQGMVQCREDELADTLETMLTPLIRVANYACSLPELGDPAAFIREGGLLLLADESNENLLPLLPTPATLPPEALDGILIRDTLGQAAWVSGLESPQAEAYTEALIAAFIAHHPTDYLTLLQQSLQPLSDAKKQAMMARIKSTQPAPLETACQPRKAWPTDPAVIARYQQRLQTWVRQRRVSETPLDHCQGLLQENKQKQLHECASRETLQAMQLQLQAYCINNQIDYYTINHPEELVCSAPFIRREGDRGVITPGPGGSFHQFLTKQRPDGERPVLLINYDQFEADDIVATNSLLDTIRRADGTLLPESMAIIGLINPHKPGCYQGADFYSRFNSVEQSPFDEQQWSAGLPPLPLIEKADNQPATPIQFYHGNDWKERLLGRWTLDRNALIFEEGELIQALQQGLPIALHNAPWDNVEFIRFWQLACLRGFIEYAGQNIPLPANLQLISQEGYPWDQLTQDVQWHNRLAREALVLNPGNLSHYITQYHCDNTDQTLTTLPGILSQHANSTLHVNVTRSLNEDQWARLLDACRPLHIQLHCHLGEGVSLPPTLGIQIPPAPASSQAQPWNGTVQDDCIIHSTDVDTTVALLTATATDWLVIDCSECNPSQLLTHLHGQLNRENGTIAFTQREQALLQALQADRRVILKGTFNANLADALATLMQGRNKTGQLVLITAEVEPFQALSPQIHAVDEAGKRRCLEQKGFSAEEIARLDSEQCQLEPLSRLITRLRFLRKHPEKPSDMAWAGLQELAKGYTLPPFDSQNSQTKAQAFHADRVRTVLEHLSLEPFVYLTGLTGVGKTSFVETLFANSPDHHLYRGQNALKQWAEDASGLQAILFLDEANLAANQWSLFEGLYNDPPGILIQGQYYPLSAHHKVVFAGNPASYGEGRTLAPFFQRHGNAVVFEPLPQEFIYEFSLKPLFENTPLAPNALYLSSIFLEIYYFLCQLSVDSVLISPRELQTMALLTVAAYQANPEQNPLKLARQIAYQLAKPLVPNKKIPQFELQFRQNLASLPASSHEQPAALGAFLITPSRQPAVDQLSHLLDLRHWRQTHPCNDSQRYGGLGGIILEGPSAAGKSEMVTALLQKRGFIEAALNAPPMDGDVYYRMPVSMPLYEKKQLLLKAFHEGAVVMIDEINAAPMMEKFLNDLLMGRNPEAAETQSLRPIKPGFMIIGTQNPVTLNGRLRASEALERRFMTIQLAAYPPEEMQQILMHRGITEKDACQLVEVFIEQAALAEKEGYTPAPTFRDLLDLASEVMAQPGYNQQPASSSTVSAVQARSFFANKNAHLQAARTADLEGQLGGCWVI